MANQRKREIRQRRKRREERLKARIREQKALKKGRKK